MGTNQILHHHPTRRFWSQPENPSKTHTQTHLQIISETLKYAVLNATPEIQTTANHTVKLWCLRRRDNYQKQFHITNNLKLLEKTQETTPGVRSQKKGLEKGFYSRAQMHGNKRIQFLRIYMWELRQAKRQQQTCHVSSSNKEEEEENKSFPTLNNLITITQKNPQLHQKTHNQKTKPFPKKM
jgi:hypothetical protein